jgi:polysaccharide biosynthesis protein PslH
MPYPLHDGGAYSLYHTALGLILQTTDVRIFALNTPKNPGDESNIPHEFRKKTRFISSAVDTRFKPVNALINLGSGRSYFVERFYSESFKAYLISILKEEEYDIVQLEHINMCLYLSTIRKYSQAKVVLRPQNVENKVWSRFLEKQFNPFTRTYLRITTRRLEKFEKIMAGKVDGIIAISPGDAETFRNYAPQTAVTNIPIGFNFKDTEFYDPDKQFSGPPVFYHLGSMDWAPNVQGIRWFIEKVLPHIMVDHPEFIFRIAGKKMPEWFFKRQNRNMVVEGEVKDSLAYHEDKGVMIVPVLSGGGLRAKIVEGMALGKTIISTTIGAEGIPCTDQENILIADTKEEFVCQIGKCLHSKEFCQKIGRNARILAKENFDCNNTAASMIRFYSQLLESADNHCQVEKNTHKNQLQTKK